MAVTTGGGTFFKVGGTGAR